MTATLNCEARLFLDFRDLGTDPLIAVPKIVGSNRILSSGSNVIGSFVLRMLIVEEQKIIPIEFGASV